MATAISYNSLSLQSSDYITEDIIDEDMPDKDVTRSKLARYHGAVETDVTYGVKKITVVGKVIGTTFSNCEALIIALKASLATDGANLDIDYNSTTMRYVATVESIKIKRPVRAANWASFEIEFAATEAFGKKTSANTLVNGVTQTNASTDHAITVGGSAPEQALIVTIEVNSLTDSGSNTISISNGEQTISVTQDWTAADTLIINGETFSVTVEGVEVEYSGIFPTYNPGADTLTVANDFTARNLTVTVTQTYRYL